MQDEDRYTRQRRLPEIGDAGQERLARASARVPGGPAAVLELVYFHRAGVGAVAIDALKPPPAFPHRAHFRYASCERHAAAAWRALRAIVELSGAADPSRRGAPS